MRVLLVVLVCVVLLLAACGPKAAEKFTNEGEPVLDERIPDLPSERSQTEADDIGVEQALGDVEGLEFEENTTAPAAPVVTEKPAGCPLVQTADVMEVCAQNSTPDVGIRDGKCVFTFQKGEVTVKSESASEGDFDQWLDENPTADEREGAFKPRSALGEYRGLKMFGWFTGSRVVVTTSDSVLVCKAGLLSKIAEKVDLKASVGNQEDLMGRGLARDNSTKKVDNALFGQILLASYDFTGSLSPVNGGNATGEVKSTYKSGNYFLTAEFTKLADPGASHYEGWIVRKGTSWHVINTGKVVKVAEKWMNTYASGTDLTDHTFYVLTLEKDDDPSPGSHVMEGYLAQ